MVIMDRQDNIIKANHLLNQSTYKSIAKDPTSSIKNKLINILKGLKLKQGLIVTLINPCTPQAVSHPSSMVSLSSTNLTLL